MPSSHFILTPVSVFPLAEGLHKLLMVHIPLSFPPATSFPFPCLLLKAAFPFFLPEALEAYGKDISTAAICTYKPSGVGAGFDRSMFDSVVGMVQSVCRDETPSLQSKES